ncbi:phosphoenolpyruvate synthase [Bradyrhizobium oligotrophicum S58]|uniref:Phosphoenolpyruvate synthase n=1 Tax=Bradyrhizobium oligotrophicum S58 TaxID=1245469 RepID=M4ZLI5_9BRAD|nr:PEP/pyruvate-binding domain-containing protein [Bradyrhizobium oligotrophicum]BAM87085.1 phosphoenolpyruvate synthase [Bradyrhizobium oligotrophicum S58]
MGADAAASFIVPFEAACEDDFPRIGGKCASLARMIAQGVRVPAGFAVATDAYALHLRSNGLEATIRDRLSRIVLDDVDDEEKLSHEIRDAIVIQPMPAAVEQSIRDAYRRMSPDGQLPVAVRSSATAEDLPDASFAGQQDTYLWVVGEDAVVEKVKACWASLFNARAISYRAENGLGQIDVLMSVGVQKMVNASAAGVAMTLDPINGDRTKIVIDSAFGLGEPVVSGEITPDNFVVEKVLLQVIKQRISEKDFELVADRAARRTVERVIAPERRTLPSLTNAQVLAVARLAKSLERSMGCPQDVEWAIDADLPEDENLVALQSRPETVWSQKKKQTTAVYETGIAGVLGTLLAPVQAKR